MQHSTTQRERYLAVDYQYIRLLLLEDNTKALCAVCFGRMRSCFRRSASMNRLPTMYEQAPNASLTPHELGISVRAHDQVGIASTPSRVAIPGTKVRFVLDGVL